MGNFSIFMRKKNRKHKPKIDGSKKDSEFQSSSCLTKMVEKSARGNEVEKENSLLFAAFHNDNSKDENRKHFYDFIMILICINLIRTARGLETTRHYSSFSAIVEISSK